MLSKPEIMDGSMALPATAKKLFQYYNLFSERIHTISNTVHLRRAENTIFVEIGKRTNSIKVSYR